jgi:hypothetical protein
MNAKERMYELAMKVLTEKTEETEKKCANYVIRTIIEKKIRKAASKGLFNAKIVVPKRYSKALVKQELEHHGFTVKDWNNNQRTMKVCW